MLIAARVFCKRAREAQIIRDLAQAGTITWDTAYNLIFSNDISRVIKSTAINFDYYDADTTYEEDVNAYVNAVVDKAAEIQAVLSKISSATDVKTYYTDVEP